MMEEGRHIVQVYVGSVSQQYEALSIEVHKNTYTQEIVACIVDRLHFINANNYYLAEVVHNGSGEECKERRLGASETPVCLQRLWPQHTASEPPETEKREYRFCLREKLPNQQYIESSPIESQLFRDYFKQFLYCQPKDKEYPDLCQLNNLTEDALLQNLKERFNNGQIYTYVGSILISVNPFKYYPIYNPKYVKLYQNHRVGELPPHIFAIADSAYHSMVKQRKNQCIVISGESGSGKTESTLFLLHHLTMLSQKGSHGSGVEQTILSSGPVLEAFGNAKTKHNNNSSRFGKFIQVSYKENGLVQGACVQKYLLEKSRICSQAYNERSYHVFYYLLAGATPQERTQLNLLRPKDYCYLNQSKCYSIEGCDEQFEFLRLKQSMEMVGFTQAKQQRLFSVLSAVLLLGNVEFQQSRVAYHHHDESVVVRNIEVVTSIATLLGVSNATLIGALTAKRARVQGEVLVINYRKPDALVARDALAKCLYGALFDWIVLQLNYSLLSLKDNSDKTTANNSIGVLDIFGFEDFANQNRFEQFCINYANERLQHYFNQHVFEYEQEEYQREGIAWTHIEFQDNVDCLALIEGKPMGLLCILDDQCSFPGATNETFLQKINNVHKDNEFYEIPQKRETAFIIHHYAGPVKYQVDDIREKNLDLMRPELITVLKHSQYCVVRELAGADPVAVFRWAILRAFCRAVQAFKGNRDAANARREQEGGRNRLNQQQHRAVPKVMIENSRILAAIENTHNRLRRTRYGSINARLRSSHATTSRHKNLQTVKALAQRTQGRGGRKLPHTVTGQFQLSLQALMETLNTANPYFIRCIKSNGNKEANVFDDELVMRQLRYTGMLETVRIRQAGYNVRITYEEFIQLYRILLPKGLLSSQADVKQFLASPNLELDLTEHQEGNTRVFMRETQRKKLDSMLHQTILSRILQIQRWYRAAHQRRLFLHIRAAVLRIQCCVRRWLAEQELLRLQLQHRAATCIQRVWRGYRQRTVYRALRRAVLGLQCAARGGAARARYREMVIATKERERAQQRDRSSSASLTTLTSSLTIDSSPPVMTLVTTTVVTASQVMTEATGDTAAVVQSPTRRHRPPPLQQQQQSPVLGVIQHATAEVHTVSSARYFQATTTVGGRSDSISSLRSDSRKSSMETDSSAEMVDQNIFTYATTASTSSRENQHVGEREQQHRTEQRRLRKERRSFGIDDQFKMSSDHYRAAQKMSPSEALRVSTDQVRSPGESSKHTASVTGNETEEVQLRKEPARRYHSSGDIGIDEKSTVDPASLVSEVPPKDQRPPPRRRSAVNIGAAQRDGTAAGDVRRQPEQWGAGRRTSNQGSSAVQDRDPLASEDTTPVARIAPATSSPPASPGSERADVAGAVAAAASTSLASNKPVKTKSFRHRLYPKVPHSHTVEAGVSPTASQESLASGEDDNNRQQQVSLSAPTHGYHHSSSVVAADSEDSLHAHHPQQQQLSVAAIIASSNKRSANLMTTETVMSSKHKYNLKKTFKSIMGKSKDGTTSYDDDTSSLSCGDSSVPPTPTLDTVTPHSYPPPGVGQSSLDTSLWSAASLTTNTSDDTLQADPDTSTHSAESSSQPPPPLPPHSAASSLSSQDIKKVLARSPHTLKQSQLKKGETCALCSKIFTSFFLKQGYKCVVCRLVFHQRCVEQSQSIPCGTLGLHSISNSPPLHHRHSIAQFSSSTTTTTTTTTTSSTRRRGAGGGGVGAAEPAAAGAGGSRVDQENRWNLTGTSQFIDRSVEVITDAQQLQALEEFITRKLFNLQMQYGPTPTSTADTDHRLQENRERKDSQVDQLFMTSLRNFKEELVSQYSVAIRLEHPEQKCKFKYKDLTNNFERIMTTVSRQQLGGSTFPVTMGVNAFRGFLDEFLESGARGAGSKKRRRRNNRRKKKDKKPAEEVVVHGSHRFSHIMVNIPTLCEVCSSFLWLSAKGLTCRSCKYTCHEKCLLKVETSCTPNYGKAVVVSTSTVKGKSSGQTEVNTTSLCKVFGVPLERQLLGVDKVPLVVERLILNIEMGGLFTEGLYRKSAATSKVREVKAMIEEDIDKVVYEELPVHVLTTLLKAFLRELPEPLLTFDAYDPLLHASLLCDPEEQCLAAFNIIENLPSLNFTLVERLFFHLARVAHQECHNRMNSNSLAIVFSPCIVRNNRALAVTESLSDVSKQTQVIERVISRRLADYRGTLAQIDTIDSETVTAGARLTSIRQSKQQALINQTGTSNVRVDPRLALQEYNLEEQITNLQVKRDLLTQQLPDMLHGGSSEEDMLDISRAGSEEDVGSIASATSGRSGLTARLREERYSSGSRDDRGYGARDDRGGYGAREERDHHTRGRSLREGREVLPQQQQQQAPPRRRHGYGRQLSEETSTANSSTPSLLSVDVADSFKRRRRLPPPRERSQEENNPHDLDDDDDTVMV